MVGRALCTQVSVGVDVTEDTREQERRLVQGLKHGEPEAFRTLHALYETSTYNLVYRMLGPFVSDSEDITQEVFITILQSISQFQQRSRLSTWIYRIAVNRCRNHLKYLRRRRMEKHVAFEEELEHSDMSPSQSDVFSRPDRAVEAMEVQQFIQAVMAHLPDEHREIVVLRDIIGLSYDEIEAITKLRAGTVKSRLFRARQALRQAYEFWNKRQNDAHTEKEST